MKKYFLILVTILLISSVSKAQVSVIVNKSVTETSISSSSLGNIYSLVETKWSNGSKVVVFDYSSDNNTKSSFYKYINKEALSLKKEWMRKQLTGEAKAPQLFSSDDEVLAKVASTPGAIGYVKSAVTNSSVKVVAEIK